MWLQAWWEEAFGAITVELRSMACTFDLPISTQEVCICSTRALL